MLNQVKSIFHEITHLLGIPIVRNPFLTEFPMLFPNHVPNLAQKIRPKHMVLAPSGATTQTVLAWWNRRTLLMRHGWSRSIGSPYGIQMGFHGVYPLVN